MKLSPEQENQTVDTILSWAHSTYPRQAHYIDKKICRRFLIARNYKFNDSQSLLKGYIEQLNFIDDNPTKFYKMDPARYWGMHQEFKECFFETDKDGYVVQYLLISQVNFDKVTKTYEIQEIINFMICRLEQFFRIMSPLVERQGKINLTRMTTVLDLKDVSPFYFLKGKPCEFLKSYIAMTQKYYPEIQQMLYIVNASTFFSALWTFVKPFLSAVTLSKTKIVKSKYIEEITKRIDIDKIPECFNGKSKQPFLEDPGPWQPYLKVSTELGTWDFATIEKEVMRRKNYFEDKAQPTIIPQQKPTPVPETKEQPKEPIATVTPTETQPTEPTDEKLETNQDNDNIMTDSDLEINDDVMHAIENLSESTVKIVQELKAHQDEEKHEHLETSLAKNIPHIKKNNPEIHENDDEVNPN